MSTPIDNPPTIEIIARGLWVHGGHILLCRNLEAGYLYFPGGHLEFGESGAVALAREMMEEAGVRVKVGACLLVGECSFTQKGRTRHEVNLMFHVEHGPAGSPQSASGASPPPVQSLEPHIAFEWVRLAEWASYDIRPAWLAGWVDRNAERFRPGLRGNADRPEWVSMMTD